MSSRIGKQLVVGKYLIPPIITGKQNELLHLVIWFRKRKIEGIGDVLLNDIAVSDADLDFEGAVINGLYANKVTIRKHLGEPDQIADSLMIKEIKWWTTEHCFRGFPYLYIRLNFDKKIFPAGIPRIAAWLQLGQQ